MEVLDRISEEYGMRVHLKKDKSNNVHQKSTMESINLASKHWTRTGSRILLLGKFTYWRCSLW